MGKDYMAGFHAGLVAALEIADNAVGASKEVRVQDFLRLLEREVDAAAARGHYPGVN